MNSNIFYKALAAVSTVGIVVIAGIQVTTALKKGNNADDQAAKTMLEIKKLRKEALAEVNLVKKEVLQDLNTFKSNALGEVKSARKDALSEIRASGANKNDSGVWLVLRWAAFRGDNSASGLQTIPMKDMETCQIQGASWEGSKPNKQESWIIKDYGKRAMWFTFHCIENR